MGPCFEDGFSWCCSGSTWSEEDGSKLCEAQDLQEVIGEGIQSPKGELLP